MRDWRPWLLALPLAFFIAACGGDSETASSQAAGDAPAGADRRGRRPGFGRRR